MMSDQSPRRRPRLDVLRGIAIVAMIAYHFTWDLGFLGFIKLNIAQTDWGLMIARGIAASFLTVVGLSLALSHSHGFDFGGFWRRLVLIAAAAALVTLGTWFAFPDAMIFMGILHCIALSSVIAALFLRAPVWIILAVAAFAFTLPLFINHMSPWPLGWILGLAPFPPRTNDYVPLFPWLGFVLTGLAVGRIVAPSARGLFSTAPLTHPVAQGLARAGRHSLAIYLVHQPLLIGALSAALFVFGPGEEERQASDFDRQCVQACLAQRDRAACETGCTCVAARLLEEGYFKPGADQSDGPQKITNAVAACTKP